MLQMQKPMCSARIEKTRLRRATVRPVASQNAGSSGRQSSIQCRRAGSGATSTVGVSIVVVMDGHQRGIDAGRGFRTATIHSPAGSSGRERPHGAAAEHVSGSSRARDPRRPGRPYGPRMGPVFEPRPPQRVDVDRGPWLALVGAGPGDPELLTRRAATLLGAADVVLHDWLCGAEVLELTRPEALRIDVGKGKGCGATQAYIQRLMLAHHAAGSRVVRLKGGDPFVFGRGMEELREAQAAGIAVEVVPGISSSIGGPALAGIAVTERSVERVRHRGLRSPRRGRQRLAGARRARRDVGRPDGRHHRAGGRPRPDRRRCRGDDAGRGGRARRQRRASARSWRPGRPGRARRAAARPVRAGDRRRRGAAGPRRRSRRRSWRASPPTPDAARRAVSATRRSAPGTVEP